MFCDITKCFIKTSIDVMADLPLKKSVQRSRHHCVPYRDTFPTRAVTRGPGTQVSCNTRWGTHHEQCLHGRFSVQTIVSSGYEDETAATKEDIYGDVAVCVHAHFANYLSFPHPAFQGLPPA